MLSAIAIGPTQSLLSYLQQICAEFKDICLYKVVPYYPRAHELIRLLNICAPEIVFLEIGGSEHPFEISTLVRSHGPTSAVIGVATACETEQFEKANSGGVTRVLVPPFSGEEFQQVLLQALDSRNAGVADNLTVFLPGKAGSGASFTALHTAGCLARCWSRKVLLIDADLESGSLHDLLNLVPQNSITNALEGSHLLDESCWSTLVSRAQGLDVLPARPSFRRQRFSRWEYYCLLSFVRRRYDMVIVDLPDVVTEATDTVFAQAKQYCVVCTPETTSLLVTHRRIETLKSLGLKGDRFHIILNCCTRSDFKIKEVEAVLEHPITAVLPKDEAAARNAVLNAELIIETSELGRGLFSLAQILGGTATETEFSKPRGLRAWFRAERAR